VAALLPAVAALAACEGSGGAMSRALGKANPFQAYYETFDGKFEAQVPELVAASNQQAAGPSSTSGRSSRVLNLGGTSREGLGLELLSMDGLIEAPALQAYLEKVLAKTLDAYPDAPRDVRVFLEASDRTTAFATPRNEIYVSLGLLDLLESESQLAAVLAHEAGHIQLNHFARQEYFDTQRELMTAGATIGILGLAAADVRIQRMPAGQLHMSQRDPLGTGADMAKLATITWMINTLSDHVLNAYWNRRQEEEADLFAVDALVKTGYDPRGTAAMLRRLGEKQEERGNLFDFIAKQRAEVEAELAKVDDPVVALNLLPQQVIRVGSATAKEIFTRMSSTHPNPLKRQEWVNGYTDREFADARLGRKELAADRDRFALAVRNGLPAAVRRGHAAANEAKVLIGSGRLTEAERLALAGVNGPTAGSAHTQTVLYLVLKAQKKPDAALRALEAIKRKELKPKMTFDALAGEYLERGRVGDAERAIEDGVRQFGTEVPFLPSLIHVEVARGDVEAAKAAHERCRPVKSEQIRAACAQALAPLGLTDVTPVTTPAFLDKIKQALQTGPSV
jgi:predicted Zn-dependent protease